MSLRTVPIVCFTLLASLLAFSTAHAAKRVALVIGNASYQAATNLRNPVNDATAISGSLKRLGFEVLQGTDLDIAAMRQLIRDFGRSANGAEIALFFYAGHGVQVDGRNYLLPVDAALSSESDLDFAAIEADLVMRQMDQGSTTKLVLLDACRDNPFEQALSRSMGSTRSATALGRGLARINAPGGSLIAFATDPGAVAYDGEGINSPFTEALLRHIETPGLEINVLLTRVRAEVYQSTNALQRPWTSSSLIGEVYLAEEAAIADTQAVSADATLEIALWNAASSGGTTADYQAYLERFPEGTFAALAANRIAALSDTDDQAIRKPDEPLAAPAAPEPQPDATPAPAVTASTAPEAEEAALALDRASRREIQERLTVLGFDPKGIDGVFGNGTRAAIRGWQTTIKAPETGYLNRSQLSVLRTQSEDGLSAYRAKRKQEQAQGTPSASSKNRSNSGYRAVAHCKAAGVRTSASHADRQQAMLLAAKACAARGASPQCCTAGVTVSQ